MKENKPSIEEKNVAIAEMLNMTFDEIGMVRPLRGMYLGETCPDWSSIRFDTNANWQYEAIDWIENVKLNALPLYYVQIGKRNCNITTEEFTINVERAKNSKAYEYFYAFSAKGETKREAVFESLYQFSQYLKQKKDG